MREEQMELRLDLNDEFIVVQDNSLIMGNYDMTSMEQKMFLIMLSTIKKDDTMIRQTTFRVKDIAELMKVTPELLYRDLPKLCKSIIGKVVEVKNPNGDWEMFNIITYAKYKSRQGIITLEINKKSEPYLIQLKEFFTAFKLENALFLDSKYAIRIYQLAKSNIYKGEFIITMDEFKKKLKLTQKSYSAFSNINLKVLTPAIKEINSKTDININIETIKVGRKVDSLKIEVSKSKGNKQKVIYNTNKKEISSRTKFNNFEARDIDYNALEDKLSNKFE